MFKKIIFFHFVVVSLFSLAQKKDSSIFILRRAEIELSKIQKGFLSRVESERVSTNKQFIAAWDKIVNNPAVLNYGFDSLTEVSILSPKNHKFKLITWNLNKDDGTQAYFGYLLVNNSKRIKKSVFKYETEESYEVFKLLDRSAQIKSPENYSGPPEKWFGMLYTQLIECDDFYTLIGWDGNDKLITRKFVDALYFKSNGVPVFGKDIFKIPRKNPRRLMFEYSSEVSMSLKYVEQKNQIVYSHLAPREEGSVMEGQFQYYGPDGSYDALELHKNKWITVEKIDARNDKSKQDNAAKPDPKKHKPVYKPK